KSTRTRRYATCVGVDGEEIRLGRGPSAVWLLGPALCLALVLPARPQQEGTKPPALPPEAVKIGADLYQIGKVTADLKAKTVTCSGKINMSKGTIEYLAVAARGKR